MTQACARDVLAHGRLNADWASYSVVLTVHDELVTEVPDDPYFTGVGLSGCMTSGPEWADGLPLAASGFETYRYRKE